MKNAYIFLIVLLLGIVLLSPCVEGTNSPETPLLLKNVAGAAVEGAGRFDTKCTWRVGAAALAPLAFFLALALYGTISSFTKGAIGTGVILLFGVVAIMLIMGYVVVRVNLASTLFD